MNARTKYRGPYRVLPQHEFNFDELIIDLFAGGGGASTGIERAIGRHVDIAVNHDIDAVRMHEVNHPKTKHYCESVWDVDPREVCAGRPVGLLHASPDCKHFSKAKGGKPRDKKIRGLAWSVLRWAATVHPRIITLENVEEFQHWGPLLEDGKPCPRRKGQTFRSFVNALHRHGYEVEWRELRACDFGAPTIRKRLFLVARRDGLPIRWPEATHGDPACEAVRSGRLKPWQTAAECIDWSIPVPSIFLSKADARKFNVKRPLEESTLRRIAKGIQRFVIDNPKPFIVKVNHGYDQFRGQEQGDPLDTVTSKNGFALVTPHITKFRTGAVGHEVSEPFHTITAGSSSKRPGGNGHAMGVVTAFLSSYYGEKRPGGDGRGAVMTEPLRTQTTENRHALIVPVLAGVGGRAGQSRPRGVEEPTATITAKADTVLVAAHLAKHYGGNYTGPGADLDQPAPTVTTVDHNALVTSHLVKLRGDNIGAPVDAPLHTVSAQGNHHGEVRAFLIKYYGEGGQWQGLDEPMHTIPTKDRLGLVMVHGEPYQIVDIGMRMLSPRELYRAQGFPSDYVIEHDGQGKAFTKEAQVARCGNSVSPAPQEALIRANWSVAIGHEVAA